MDWEIPFLVTAGGGACAVAATSLVLTPGSWTALRRRLLEHLALAARRGLPLGAAVGALAEERRPASRARSPVSGALNLALRRELRQVELLERIAGLLDATGSLAAALEAAPELGLSPERLALLRAAEARGALPELLAQLADEQLAAEDARGVVLSSAIYPVFLTFVLVLVGVFMTLVIQPRLHELVRHMFSAPHAAMEAWGALSEALPLLAVPVAAIGVVLWLQRATLRAPLLAVAERTPWLGQALRRWHTGLSLQRVGILLGAGATLPEALDDAALGATARGARAARSAAALAREGGRPLDCLERLLERDAPALAARVALEVERAPTFADGVRAAGVVTSARARDRLAELVVLVRPVPLVLCALAVGSMHLAVWDPIVSLQSAILETIE